MDGIAIAKQNYAFIESHAACPLDRFQVDDAGRLSLKEASQSIAGSVKSFFLGASLEKRVEAALFRAKVWGHVIPEIRRLRENDSDGDSHTIRVLLGKVAVLRKENPFSDPRFQELLDTLEVGLEELGPAPLEIKQRLPWAKIAMTSVVGLAIISALVNLYLQPPSLDLSTVLNISIGSDMQKALLFRTMQAAFLVVAGMGARAASQAPDQSFKQTTLNIVTLVAFAAFTVSFIGESSGANKVYQLFRGGA